MPIERELKYSLSGRSVAKALMEDVDLASYAVSTWRNEPLSSVYYDTLDGRLQQQGMVLRLRRAPEEVVLCCKYRGEVSDGLHQRHEDEIVLQDIPEKPNDLPWHLLPSQEALRELLGDATLQETVRTEFNRCSLLLQWRDARVELAIDDGFLAGQNQKAPLLELELELKDGAVEDLLSLGEYLAAKYGLAAEARSKFERAMKL